MKRLGCLVLAMSMHGCSCLFGGFEGFGGFDASGFVVPRLVDGGEVTVEHPDCASATPITAAELLAAPRRPAVADGVVDSPVDALGCTVIRDTYQGGRRVGLSLRQFGGYLEVIDEPQMLFAEKETVFLEATFGADGSLHADLDLDGDGERDAALDEVRAARRLQTRTMTSYDDANGAVLRRETVRILDAAKQRFTVEALVAGALTTVSDFEASVVQNQTVACYGPRAPVGTPDTAPCGKTDAELRAMVHDALASYSSCLSSYGGTWQLAQLEVFLLDDIKTDEMSIECFRDPSYFGQADSASDTLRLNADLLSGCEGTSFVNSTIVHEMLHFTRGPHEFDSPSGPYGPRAAAYSDPMRACEELCFGTLKTKCACARCLGTKACDARCSGLDTCRVDPPDGGAATMSEAVGAHCRSTNAWYPTMAQCSSAGACPGGKSGCKSYSVSCDESCQ